ncbi:transposase, partial [Faunimonas pinastri]
QDPDDLLFRESRSLHSVRPSFQGPDSNAAWRIFLGAGHEACDLKARCTPREPARKIPRSIHEGARNMARDIMKIEEGQTSKRQRKKVEMLFAHLNRILKLDRLRLRGPNGARDEFHLAATAQNLRKMVKLIPMLGLKPA